LKHCLYQSLSPPKLTDPYRINHSHRKAPARLARGLAAPQIWKQGE